MSVTEKQWLDVRESLDAAQPELSYIRLQDIERISIVEESASAIRIYVNALGNRFLFAVVETIQEAESTCKGLIRDIERSKSASKREGASNE